jgi:ribonuclease-3
MKSDITKLEKKMGYSFKKKDLLLQALTHSSYAYEIQDDGLKDNEVLEFLGDSILGFIIAEYLYFSNPDISEGELSKLKSAVASTLALNKLARKIHLYKRIQLGKGEEKSGGRKKRTILAGTYEAVVAAVYLDGGLDAVKNFLTPHLDAFFKKVDTKKFLVNNYKSALQEHLQRDSLPAPVYKTVTTIGPDHKKSFVIKVSSGKETLASATGSSKKDAEQKAAQKAIKVLLGQKIKTLTPDTFLVKKKND